MEKNKIMQLLLPAIAGAALLALILFLLVGKNEPEKAKVHQLPDASGHIPDSQQSKSIDIEGMAKELPDINEEGYQTQPNGLKIKDIVVGEGSPCPEGVSVLCHYAGWQLDGKMFDSTYLKGRPPYDTSLYNVIKGWTYGIPGMKPGGVRRLVIPKELAYGNGGGGRPGGTLVFDIKLIRWQ